MKRLMFIFVYFALINFAANAQLAWPVTGSDWDDITSTFGPRYYNGYDTHRGLDVGGSTNDIVSVDDEGIVVEAPINNSVFAVIKYPGTNNPNNEPYFIRYYHFGSRNISENDTVSMSEVLGQYAAGQGHVDIKYYPNPDNNDNQYDIPQSSQHPLHILPYTQNNGASIDNDDVWLATYDNNDSQAPSDYYVGVIVNDFDADMNKLVVFLSAETSSGFTISEDELIMGNNGLKNEVNYDDRLNYGEYGRCVRSW